MMDKKYKIVFCTPAIYSAGGVERVVTVKANYFAEVLGYDVKIIVTEGKDKESFFPLSNKVSIINLKIGFEEIWHYSLLKKIVIYLQKQRKYRKVLSAELIHIQPDFTISTLRREINFLTKVRDGSVKIGELHVNRANYRNIDERGAGVIKRLFSHYWMNNLVRHLKKLEKMVVLTESALSDWPELNNVSLIPDPLPCKLDEVSDLSRKRIISIGRYAYDKGDDLLLQVWSKVEKRSPDWRLEIFGMGEREPYNNLMEELGIDTKRCFLHGPISDVKKEYLNSSIFVLPSRFEGFGLVLIEAMACGVPVVSFDCENGPRSVITNGVEGFLIPTFDIDVFAEKLQLLMQNQSLREQMGRNGRERVQQFDIEKIGCRWKQLFDELKRNNDV